MEKTRLENNLAILWRHNKNTHPRFLDDIHAGVQIWWDVGFKINPNQFNYPLTGYLWNTIEDAATHRATISRIETQPSEGRVQEVIESWDDARIRFNPNSPILKYRRDRSKTCTLLNITDLRMLSNPAQLHTFILAKGHRSIRPGRWVRAIINDPNLATI